VTAGLITHAKCCRHANELAAVGSGDTVAVWGAGPVGLLCSFWAKHRGASNVVVIDSIPARLQMAIEHAGARVACSQWIASGVVGH